MKKKFKMQELDCADCARKMKDLIKKIPGVNDASIEILVLQRDCIILGKKK